MYCIVLYMHTYWLSDVMYVYRFVSSVEVLQPSVGQLPQFNLCTFFLKICIYVLYIYMLFIYYIIVLSVLFILIILIVHFITCFFELHVVFCVYFILSHLHCVLVKDQLTLLSWI